MDMIDAGKCLKKAQASVGMTSRDLANLTNTSPQQIIRWKANKNMKLHAIQVLSRALGITVNDFIGFEFK
mgnify:CR=1